MTTAAADTKVAVARLIEFLETGIVSDGLFAPDVFLDVSLPQWRVQADTAEDAISVRASGHPFPGQVRRRAGEPDRHRVRHRVRGAVGAPGPELVLPGDDPGRRGGRHHRRDGGLLHRRLGRGQAARARQRRTTAPSLTGEPTIGAVSLSIER